MKFWYCLTCPVCGFRYTLGRITRTVEPIRHPAQLVTGGGRGRGFHVAEYIPWSDIPKFKENPEVWRALNCEYLRLSSAYDNFHHYLGFLSPSMSKVIDSLSGVVPSSSRLPRASGSTRPATADVSMWRSVI